MSLRIFPSQFQFDGKFSLFLSIIVIKVSQQNFAHATTAELSWHVQNFVGIWWWGTEVMADKIEIPNEFEFLEKKLLVKRPSGGTLKHEETWLIIGRWLYTICLKESKLKIWNAIRVGLTNDDWWMHTQPTKKQKTKTKQNKKKQKNTDRVL